MPWFVRNVLITGWLLYPFPALDLFQVDWKMKYVSIIIVDAELIGIYAKGLQDVGINVPVQEWFPHWFSTQLFSTEKILILVDIVACLIVPVLLGWITIKKQWQKLDVCLVMCTVLCSYLFWQFSAPMMRYGYAHVLLVATIVFGYLLEQLPPIKQFKLTNIVYVGICMFCIYKVCVGGSYIYDNRFSESLVWQQTYGEYVTESYEVDGVTLYYSLEGGLSGYDPFPAGPDKQTEIELRGDGLKDGFRLIGD